MLNSFEVQEEMPAWHRRVVLNAVNNPPRESNSFDLNNGYTYERNIEYANNFAIHEYTIRHNNSYVARFKNMQYPNCCGISILFDFSCDNRLANKSDFVDALSYFFQKTYSSWKPNIQFVAVKQAEREEIYDEDDNEYYDKINGINESYDYNSLIVALSKVLKPTLLSSFINPNSDNQCDLYQAVNPYRS